MTAQPAATDLPTVPHWIDGAETPGSGSRTAPVYDPALGIETKRRRARRRRRPSSRPWPPRRPPSPPGATSPSPSARPVIFRFRELLDARKGELAEIITSEHGKVLSDALGEITRGQEVVEFATGLAHHLKGEYSEQVSTGVDVYSLRQPLGVVGIISPVQLPGDGADVVLPDRDRRRQRRHPQAEREGPVRRDLDGAASGRRPACPTASSPCSTATRRPSTACSPTRMCKAISFVGSTPIARYVYETGTAHGKRVQALGGAKNHMLVLPDADLDLVADSAINAGFGSAGERCMAISVVVAVEPVADDADREDHRTDVDPHDRRRPPLLRHGPARHRDSTATRSPATSTSPQADGADRRRRRPRRSRSTETRTDSGSARP